MGVRAGTSLQTGNQPVGGALARHARRHLPVCQLAPRSLALGSATGSSGSDL